MAAAPHLGMFMTARKKAKSKKPSHAELAAKLEALDRVQACIELAPDGTILTANQNFLTALGYELDEICGHNHSMFVEPAEAHSDAYREHWQKLREGQSLTGEWKRIGKGGREVWILGSYNPICDARGSVKKIVKLATDVTERKRHSADVAGQLAAIHKVQAVVELDLDGHVLAVNDLFVRATGYQPEEVLGKHHSMFVEPSYAASAAYKEFWRRLAGGQYDAGEYKRIGKGGRELWIQASYNPILDANGKPLKVVKYATDVTQQKQKSANFAGQIAAIGKSQAVIEFDMQGTVLSANDNFLSALGYRREEIVGKHHRMFVDPSYATSGEYSAFWQRLNAGQFDAGEYKRLGKGGREVWIQATYNPIFDLNGKPYKVVKYATDVSVQKRAFLELMRAIDALSRGDLTTTVQGEFKGDFAHLRDQLNGSFETLSRLVRQISEVAFAINAAARDISEGNANLSKRTQEEASSLEETAASLEELTVTVKQNALNAAQAAELAANAQHAAEKGGQVVSEAIGAMSAITQSSKRVADIISVIEQLAFQTNMLALNAAVEAARAGDQGRGFAVVAAEVRNLAQRSATAAKEIKALIQDSQEKVAQGAKLVNHSGETLQEIVGSVRKVTSIVGDIDVASNQQSSGIQQINQAVAAMDQNTQQNAALVEEAAAAADSMREQTRGLTEVVRYFTIESPEEGKRKPAPRLGQAGTALQR